MMTCCNRRRYILSLCAIAALVCALVKIDAIAQEKSLKEQLVGTWMLLLSSTKLPDGTDVTPCIGMDQTIASLPCAKTTFSM